MATSRKTIRDPSAWQKLAAFFAFFAVLKDAPTFLRRLVPAAVRYQPVRRLLLRFVDSGDFWWSWLFLAITLGFLLRVLWPLHSEELVDEDVPRDAKLRDRLEAALRRNRRIRIARTLGLVLVREKLLDLLGVERYGTFQRRNFATQEPAPDRFDYIDRITFTGGRGCEYQYPRAWGHVFVREHPAGSSEYGPPERRKLTSDEVKVLLIASNFYLLWLLQRPWAWLFRPSY